MNDGDAVSNAVLAQSISALRETMGEVKSLVTSLGAQLQAVQLEKVSAHALLDAKIQAAYSRMDEQAKAITELKDGLKEIGKLMPTLVTAYRIMAFVGTTLGASVIVLIWSLITGQVRLVTP